MIKVEVPDKLGRELDKIDWSKVKQFDLDLLITIGLPYLKNKGYLKKTEENGSEYLKKNSF